MVRAAIFGISGYAGQKLLEILLAHPEAEVTLGFVAPDEKSMSADEVDPRMRKIAHFPCSNAVDWEAIEKKADCVFLALPHIVSMGFVPELLKRGKKVIDLSADYRFSDASLYRKWYAPHTSAELLSEAVYGLPERYRDEIRGARLIANPGCYPTSALLALLPFAKKGLLDGDIIVNSLSGFSGAGKKPDTGTMFVEGNENSRAYKIGEHRHQPEIEHILDKSGAKSRVTFVPHLIPVTAGMLSTIYFSLSADMAEADIQKTFEDAYANEPFVRVMAYGTSPAVKNVVGSNFCDIGVRKVAPKKCVAVSVIDNLVKGAAGQAVQNMNIIYGFPETLPFYR